MRSLLGTLAQWVNMLFPPGLRYEGGPLHNRHLPADRSDTANMVLRINHDSGSGCYRMVYEGDDKYLKWYPDQS